MRLASHGGGARAGYGRRSAFTLVELLIVIAILAILMAVAIPSTAGLAEDARYSAQMTSFHGLERALDAYKAKHGTLPADQNQDVYPPELSEFYPQEAWGLKPPLGMYWDWNPSWGPADLRPMISIVQNPPPVAQWLELDERFDDGNLGTGNLRRHNTKFLSYGI